jgi:hypothetical protein
MDDNPRSSIFQWLERNSLWSHWVGLLIAAAGLFAGFLLSEKQHGEVTVKFTTVKIAQAGVPGIRILDNANAPITSNIFGTEVLIWNTGDLNLGDKSDRVRKPIRITFDGNIRVIDGVIQDTKNLDPKNVTISTGQNDVVVKWTELDPGDAIKVFVIYSGDQQAKIEYEGRIIGATIADYSEFREEYPGESGLAATWHSFRYDLKYRTWSTTVIVVGTLTQMVGFVLMFFGRKRLVGRLFPWAMGAGMVIMFMGLAMRGIGSGTPL